MKNKKVFTCAQCHRVVEIGEDVVRTKKGVEHQKCPNQIPDGAVLDRGEEESELDRAMR